MNIGDPLPETLGRDQDGNEIKTASYRGQKLILYAYPKDSTPGCTAEACSLQTHKNELSEAGYAIVGVSKDSAASHKKFIDKNGLTFPLISDTDTTLLQSIGAWGEKVACGRHTIGTLRTTIVADENGIVTHIFTPKEIKTNKHAEQILAL